jgi:hypothetical protein
MTNNTKLTIDMIYSAVLFASLAALGSASTWQSPDYKFETFLKEFRIKQDWTSEQFAERKSIFQNELAAVRAHNKAGASWTAGINKFSAMTKSEKQSMNGYAKNSAKAHKHTLKKSSTMNVKSVSELPSSMDWRNVTNVVSNVKDQGT